MTKYRGHFCRIGGSLRPNEAFSGKGHRTHVCKKCADLPKEEREEIECRDEIFFTDSKKPALSWRMGFR
jgi:hypothetical protein